MTILLTPTAPFGQTEIQSLIPHRAPMLLLDEVTTFATTAAGPGSTLTAQRKIAAEDPVLAGHFPGFPVYPGVLSVEAMAQSAAVLTSLWSHKKSEEALFLFMGLENVRFRAPVLPNQTLTLQVTMAKTKRQIYWFTGTASVDETLCVEASFMAKHELKAGA